jgi:hypothetical protein
MSPVRACLPKCFANVRLRGPHSVAFAQRRRICRASAQRYAYSSTALTVWCVCRLMPVRTIPSRAEHPVGFFKIKLVGETTSGILPSRRRLSILFSADWFRRRNVDGMLDPRRDGRASMSPNSVNVPHSHMCMNPPVQRFLRIH